LRTSKGVHFLPPLFKIVLEVLASEEKGINVGKEEVKLPLFADGMILHIEVPRSHQKNY